MPRKEGMERKDLLAANVDIFKVQGEALDKYARKDVKVLVVGNPANTNALICSHYAPSIPKENFTAMTRLDQNRAQAALAVRLDVQVITRCSLDAPLLALYLRNTRLILSCIIRMRLELDATLSLFLSS